MLVKNGRTSNKADEITSRRQYTLLSIAVILCYILIVIIFSYLRGWEHNLLESEFKRNTSIHATTLQKEIDRNVDIINSIAGLQTASKHVDRDEFRAFTQQILNRHPEIIKLEWVPHIEQKNRPAFEKISNSEITEKNKAGKVISAVTKSSYFPVYYVEPLQGNENSIGYNIASNDTINTVMNTARDLNGPATTPWNKIAPDFQRHSFKIIIPVYSKKQYHETVEQRRKNLSGFIVGSYDATYMIEESLKQLNDLGFEYSIFSDTTPTYLNADHYHSYDSSVDTVSHSHSVDTDVQFSLNVTLDLPEKKWSILFKPTPEFYKLNSKHVSISTLISGLLLITALAFYLFNMLRQSQIDRSTANDLKALNIKLEQEVIDRNLAEKALVANESKYHTLVEYAPEAITVLNADTGKFDQVNLQAEKFFCMSRKQLLAIGPADLSPKKQPNGQNSETAALEYIQRAINGGMPIFEWTHIDSNGKETPCEIRLIRLPDSDKTLIRGSIVDISKRKEAECLQERLGRILDNSSNEIYIFDAKTLFFTQVNKGARENLGYSMQELTTLKPFDLKPQFNEQQFNKMLVPLRSGESDKLIFITEHQRKDGTKYPVEIILHLSREETPQVFVAIVQDISERVKTEKALRESEQYNRMLFEESTIGLELSLLNGDPVDVNRSFASIIGRTVDETLQMSSSEITPSKYDSSEQTQLEILKETGRYGPYEKEFIHKDGHLIPVRLTGRIIEKEGVQFIWSSVEDITTYRQASARIDHLAYHDTLTGLPNRELLKEHLVHAINMTGRNKSNVGVLFLDIDRFKSINDSLGHDIGDQLLRLAANRLSELVRETDTVARFGGDEFVIIIEDVSGKENIEILAGKIIDCMEEPFSIGSRELYVTTSIGVSICPQNSSQYDELITQADIAMYQAKNSGRNNYKFYSSNMAERIIYKTSMERDLRGAEERGELFFHYQPIVDPENGQIMSVEMLMRWQHPKRGLVSPGEFIPVMEESGMIVEMSFWALEQACKYCKKIRNRTQQDISVAVNFSAPCFHHEGIINYVKNALKKTGTDPHQLIFEITESTLFNDSQSVRPVMEELQSMGIRIALDDFGTGQSSLSHIRKFPIDIVKIDRSFVRDIPGDKNDCELVAAIIAMAHNLNKCVVAEGVETETQLEFLQRHKCNRIQGYLFSKPIPGNELLTKLESESDLEVLS